MRITEKLVKLASTAAKETSNLQYFINAIRKAGVPSFQIYVPKGTTKEKISGLNGNQCNHILNAMDRFCF